MVVSVVFKNLSDVLNLCVKESLFLRNYGDVISLLNATPNYSLTYTDRDVTIFNVKKESMLVPLCRELNVLVVPLRKSLDVFKENVRIEVQYFDKRFVVDGVVVSKSSEPHPLEATLRGLHYEGADLFVSRQAFKNMGFNDYYNDMCRCSLDLDARVLSHVKDVNGISGTLKVSLEKSKGMLRTDLRYV